MTYLYSFIREIYKTISSKLNTIFKIFKKQLNSTLKKKKFFFSFSLQSKPTLVIPYEIYIFIILIFFIVLYYNGLVKS